MKKLKIRKIGNSSGIVLPKEVLAEMGLKEGDELTLTKRPDGYAIGNRDDKFTRTMEIAEKFMKQYRNSLRELAK